MEEIWKDIKGYEGLYQVSNLGNVKSLNYNHTGKGEILKCDLANTGYFQATLYKKGKNERFRVHRLVAQAFIGDIPKGMVINHINGVKTDNRVENLEICTYSYNLKEAYRIGLATPPRSALGKFGILNPGSKKINQLTLKGEIINAFYGISEAGRQTGINFQNISSCCRGERYTAGGYKWEYAKEVIE